MNVRRIFVRILKFLLCLVSLWLFLAILWVAVPSDMPTDTDSSNALHRGDVVSPAYNPSIFYLFSDPIPDVSRASRSDYTILDVKLERTTETNPSYSLVLGIPHNFKPFGFGRSRFALPPQTTIPLVIPDETLDVNVSSPLTFTSRTSDYCGVHLIGWINRADVDLTCWWLQQDWSGQWPWIGFARTPVRTRTVPTNRTIELWPQSSDWERPDSPWNPPKMGPFLTIKLYGNNQAPVFAFHPASLSPSKLFPFRMVFLALLVLIPLHFNDVLILLIYCVHVALYWLAALGTFTACLVIFIVGCIALSGIFWWLRAGSPHISLGELVETIRNVIADNGRRERIALPDDNVEA